MIGGKRVIKEGPVIVVGGNRIRRAKVIDCLNCNRVLVKATAELNRGGERYYYRNKSTRLTGQFCDSSCAMTYRKLSICTLCVQCGKSIPVDRLNYVTSRHIYKWCSLKCRILDTHAKVLPPNTTKGKRHYGAREVYRVAKGEPDKCIVPWCAGGRISVRHKNGNTYDNRPRNLVAVCQKHLKRYPTLI